jgi:hypothetical protein
VGFVVLGAVLLTIYAGERTTALVRRATVNRRRAKADYPISDNDPIGRAVV